MNSDRYPILKMLIPYILGVFSAYFGNFSRQNCFLFISVILISLTISAILFAKLSYKLQWIPAVFLLFSSFLLGFFLTNFHFSPKFDTPTEQKITENRLWDVSVMSAPIVKERSVKITAQLHNTLEGEPVREKVILYVRKDSNALRLRHGDRLLVNTRLERAPPPQNPYAFDNRLFLQRRGIYFTGFVEAGGWRKIDSALSVRRAAAQLQSFFAKQFRTSGLDGEEYAVITAILLGADDTMPPTLKASYATAGVSHILCVSGMHVGIIFMILDFLLKPLALNRNTNIIKTILLLLFIWAYAHITGLSPSVTRAAAMFTFVSFGSLLNRNTDIFHSLAASLTVLLFINPLLIFEVGLQLSYAAVFGIVTFQPLLGKLLRPKTKIGNYFWSLATVSVAAQASTFPISVLYFGQFPNYFLISNLSVIFLSFIIVISGIVTLCVSAIPKISVICGTILFHEIKIMNRIIGLVEGLPFSLTDNISWTPTQIFALYLFIIFFYIFIVKKKTKFLTISLTALSIFLIISNLNKIRNTHTCEITFYAIQKHSCIGLNSNGNGILLADSLFTKDGKEYSYSVKNHELRCGIKSKIVRIEQELRGADYIKCGNWLCFRGKTIYILCDNRKIHCNNRHLKADYILLSGKPPDNPEMVMQAIDFGMVIADGSCSYYCKSKWKQWCQATGKAFYDISESGFLTIAVD
ncbi:MAG: ComEC family competence protein [Bacteroidales bacterium]|nr:ComEC family competence protein [Bacteroidales bacterium]